MRWIGLLVVVACGDNIVDTSEGLLSSEGLYVDMRTKLVTDDAIELQPQFALWADGADKRRWITLPAGTEIDTSNMDHWQVPVGTKLFKEFWVGGRRVETRVIEREESQFRFAPYLWLADESDAVLVPDGADDVLGTQHDIPPATDCIGCHQSEPGKLLGVSAIQLSGMFERLPLSQRPNRRFEVPDTALGVLHANCGHCHTAGGMASFQQLRFSIADADLPIEQTAPYLSMVGQPLTTWTNAAFEYRVMPGNPDESAIYYRMSTREIIDQMPPLATEVPDEVGLAAVRAWIASL
jgi:hypothetical protein